VSALAFSPDGKYLAAGYDENGHPGSPDPLPEKLQVLTLWELERGDVVWTFRGQKKGPLALAFSADGRTLFSAGREGVVRAWSLGTGKLARSFRISPHQLELAFTPDGRQLLVGSSEISLWDVEQGKSVYARAFLGGVRFLAVSPDGKLAFLGKDQGIDKFGRDHPSLVCIWDVKEGKALVSAPSEMVKNRYSRPGAFDAESRFVFSNKATTKGPVYSLWEARSGKEVRSFPAKINDLASHFAFLENGKTVLVTGYYKDSIYCLDPMSGEKIWEQKTRYNHIHAFGIAKNRRIAATFSGWPRFFPAESSLQIWDANTGRNIRTLALPQPR
jgi:WD40 repeat protein